MERKAKARYLQKSGVLSHANYSYKTRFERASGPILKNWSGQHMQDVFHEAGILSLQATNITPLSIETIVGLDKGSISEIHLYTRVKADGLDQETFQKYALDAKENCPVSKLVNAVVSPRCRVSKLASVLLAYIFARACSKSWMRSCTSSIPTEILKRFGGLTLAAPSADCLWSTRLSTPPRLVACWWSNADWKPVLMFQELLLWRG